jgi:hypothetical protein
MGRTSGGSGGGGAVSSVFGRTAAVTAQSGDYTVAQVTGAAPAANPTLTGTVTVPTPTAGDNSTKAASTAFVVTEAVPAAAFVTGAAPPTAVAPASIGQLYVDTTNGGLYLGMGTSTGNWVQIGGHDPSYPEFVGVDSQLAATSGVQVSADATHFLGVNSGQVEATSGATGGMALTSNFSAIGGALNTSIPATVNTQSFSTGEAFVPNAAGDCLLTGWVGHAGTLTITMGPSTGAENTLWSAVAVLADSPISWWVPAGWSCVITLASSATITNLHKTLI